MAPIEITREMLDRGKRALEMNDIDWRYPEGDARDVLIAVFGEKGVILPEEPET